MKATILGPGVAVPAELAGYVSQALALLAADHRRNGVGWPAELATLAAICKALADAHARMGAGIAAVTPDGGSGGRGGIAADQPKPKMSVATSGNWLTVTDVSSLLGVSGRRIRQLASSGQLAGVRRPDGWRFDAAVVSHFAESRNL